MSGVAATIPIPEASAAVSRRKLGFVQSLRAVAATGVAISHIVKEIFHGAEAGTWVLNEFMLWQFGVDLFFLISGFIMYYITDSRSIGLGDAWNFLMRRLVRIVPLYWFYMSLFLLVGVLASDALHTAVISAPYIAKSYLFLPAVRPGTDEIAPFFTLGWTLNYEMMFYAIYAVLIALSFRRTLLPIVFVLGALALVGPLVPEGLAPLWYWTRTIVIEFVFGAIVAHLFRSGTLRFKLPVGIAVIVAGILIWQASGIAWPVREPAVNVRGLTWGVAALFMVGGVALTPSVVDRMETLGKGFVGKIGDASYSLYLSHMFVVRAMTMLFAHLFGATLGGGIAILYFVATLGLSFLVAIASFYAIERPAIAFGRRYIHK
jgi:exopolysaccharide production protein ExoZ